MFVALILIFLIPFGTAVETILNKTQRPSMTVITNAFNRAYWVVIRICCLVSIIINFFLILMFSKSEDDTKITWYS